MRVFIIKLDTIFNGVFYDLHISLYMSESLFYKVGVVSNPSKSSYLFLSVLSDLSPLMYIFEVNLFEYFFPKLSVLLSL